MLTNGEVFAFYNLIAFVVAFAMVPLVRKHGPGPLHALCLVAGGISMLILPQVETKAMLFPAVIGVGLAWGSIMGNPYAILSNAIPAERTGVYMGIFNMMIVIPMLLFAVVMGKLNLYFFSIGFGAYAGLLGGDPRNLLMVCGACLIAAGAAVMWVREGRGAIVNEPLLAGG